MICFFKYCLQYLLNYLKTSLVSRNNSPNCSQTEEALEKDTEDAASKIPSILQVVSLFCCFVDAHFTHITLSGKAQELIADALQLIETQVKSLSFLFNVKCINVCIYIYFYFYNF